MGLLPDRLYSDPVARTLPVLYRFNIPIITHNKTGPLSEAPTTKP